MSLAPLSPHPPPALLDRCHRAAIALNNNAVSRLVRGQYREAALVLSDAIDIMTLMTLLCDEADWAMLQRLVDQSLDRANATRQATGPERVTPLHVVSSRFHPVRLYEIFTTRPKAWLLTFSFPVRIDLIDYDALTEDEARFHSVIITFNYGIALNSIVNTSIDPLETPPPIHKGVLGPVTRDNARHMFRKAASMILAMGHDTTLRISPELGSQLLVVQIVLANSLVFVTSKLGLQPEFNQYCYSMQRLLRMVMERHSRLPLTDDKQAPAA